ncbi:MAG: 4Fe-4S dicluster domain-containing protein [Thermoguttaceae bacterium]
MGHIATLDHKYGLLQRQLERTVTGAPPSPRLLEILRLLYSKEDVELAARLPLPLTDAKRLARRLRLPLPLLVDRLSAMAQRGLVFDVEHEGRRYFSLAPLALGFFEFTFMRTRGDLPQRQLAQLFDDYMREDAAGGIYRSVFEGPTQIGRTLVREESLSERQTEVLDWERASHLVKTASAIGVGLCACRHLASHLGQACDRPQRVCLTLNYAAKSLVRNGLADPVTAGEAMRILEQSKESGLVQIADNVKQRVAYICNCCGCCCEMFHAVHVGNIRNAITSSNWIMQIDRPKCSGCGQCASVCPMRAIALTPAGDDAAPAGHAQTPQHQAARLCQELCLGCGVCVAACPNRAISMSPREQRALTPATVVERMLLMAIERRRLADFLFDRHGPVSHRVLGHLVAILERTPLPKALAAIRPLRSIFLNAAVAISPKPLVELTRETGDEQANR